jgi:hypothetical protein
MTDTNYPPRSSEQPTWDLLAAILAILEAARKGSELP